MMCCCHMETGLRTFQRECRPLKGRRTDGTESGASSGPGRCPPTNRCRSPPAGRGRPSRSWRTRSPGPRRPPGRRRSAQGWRGCPGPGGRCLPTGRCGAGGAVRRCPAGRRLESAIDGTSVYLFIRASISSMLRRRSPTRSSGAPSVTRMSFSRRMPMPSSAT